MGTAATMDRTLFDDPDVDRPDPEVRASVRRAVLGGVLKVWRTRKGWSVNDAAAASGMAPMTWRRVETALPVRRHAETQIDQILGQPFGTVRRALDDDLAMVTLSGIAVDAGIVKDPAAYLDELAERFRSGTVPNGITAATRPPSRPVIPPAVAVPEPTAGLVTATAALIDRLVREAAPMTEAVENAVASLLAAMPDLVLRARPGDITPAVEILVDNGNVTLQQAGAELRASQPPT